MFRLMGSVDQRTAIAREALRNGLLAVGSVHLRYKHGPDDYSGAAKLFAEFRRRILDGLTAYMMEDAFSAERRAMGADDDMMLCALVLITTAGVSGCRGAGFSQ